MVLVFEVVLLILQTWSNFSLPQVKNICHWLLCCVVECTQLHLLRFWNIMKGSLHSLSLQLLHLLLLYSWGSVHACLYVFILGRFSFWLNMTKPEQAEHLNFLERYLMAPFLIETCSFHFPKKVLSVYVLNLYIQTFNVNFST